MLQDILSQITPFTINYPLLFGMFMILGVVAGLITSRIVWLPTISGFMLIGFAMGPEGLSVFNGKVLEQAESLVQIALGLILYKLGCSIHPEWIIKNKRLALVSLAESGTSFFAVLALLLAFGTPLMIAVLVAAIGISSSPAVLVHVASEMRAKGTVTDNTKILVALNNLTSFIVFSMALPFALYSTEATWHDVVGIPLYRLFGGLAVGSGVAVAVMYLARYLKRDTLHYTFPLVLGGIMTTLGLTLLFQMSFLFSCLVFGIMVRWLERREHQITQTDFGYAEDIFFIILFVTAGAKLHINELIEAGWLAILFPLTRCAMKYTALIGAGKNLGFNLRQSSASGMLLMPMAGMAIGLLQTTNALLPAMASQVAILVFAAVAVLETLGPPLAKWAFRISGEAHTEDHGADTAPVVIPAPKTDA